jgi:M6 family metalloprotease-like protein
VKAIRTTVCVLVSALLIAGSVQVKGGPAPVGMASGADPGTWVKGPQPFVTILCRFADSEGEPEPPSYFAMIMGDAYPGLGDYWREVSYGQVSLAGSRVIGWYTLPEPWAAYLANGFHLPDTERLSAACIHAANADVYFPDYTGINLAFDADYQGRALGGRATVELDGVSKSYGITWIWRNRFHEQATWAHEMGHAFGLSHSSTREDGEEYDNPWDVMSASGPCSPDSLYGSVGQHPIAYDKYILGWIPPGRVYVAPQQGQAAVVLTRLAQPGAEGYLLAMVPIAGSRTHFYTVEARRRVGYDVHLPSDAVLIHEVDESRPRPAQLVGRIAQGNGSVDEGVWTVGSRFADRQHGIAISVEAETAAGYAVKMVTGLPPEQGVPEGKHRESASRGQSAGLALPAAAVASGGPIAVAETPWGDQWLLWVTRCEGAGVMPESTDIWLARRRLGPGALAAGTAEGWEAAIRLNTATGLTLDPAVAADGAGNAYVVWSALEGYGSDIYFAYLPASGGGGSRERVSAGTRGVPGWAWTPAIAVDSRTNVYVAWVGARDGAQAIYLACRAADAGSASEEGRWGPSTRLRDGYPGQVANPAIAVDRQGNLYAAWIATPFCTGIKGYIGVIEATVRPAGGEWGPVAQVTAGVGGDELPRLAIEFEEDGANAAVERPFVSWVDNTGQIVRAPLTGPDGQP